MAVFSISERSAPHIVRWMNIDNYRILSPGQRWGRIDWIVILCNNLQIETEGGGGCYCRVAIRSPWNVQAARQLKTITAPLNRVVTGYARTPSSESHRVYVQ